MASNRRKVRDELLSRRESFALPELVEVLATEFDLHRVTALRTLVEGLVNGLFDESQPETHQPAAPMSPRQTATNDEALNLFGPHRPPRRTGWTREAEPEPEQIYWDDLLFFENYDPDLINHGGFANISISRSALDRYFDRNPPLPRPSFLRTRQKNGRMDAEPVSLQDSRPRKLTPDEAVEIFNMPRLEQRYRKLRWTAGLLIELFEAIFRPQSSSPLPADTHRWANHVLTKLSLPRYNPGKKPSPAEKREIRKLIKDEPPLTKEEFDFTSR